MITDEDIASRYNQLLPTFNEKSRRLFAAAEAIAIGHGGVSRLSRITGLSRQAISNGQKELKYGTFANNNRIRISGGGRKKTTSIDSTLISDLLKLIDLVTRGSPESPLLWSCTSTRSLAAELIAKGHCTSQRSVCRLLHELGYSLQSNRKTLEGNQHPDRNAQFEHISNTVSQAILEDQPVISVDTKKKELLGNYKNNGCQWRPQKSALPVNGHDFPSPDIPRARPYGIYDLAQNTGFVVVGSDHDTSEFAVSSIRGWWQKDGSQLYPNAKRLCITADSDDSNGYRSWLWKVEIQRLADETGLDIKVIHFPSGTSKWNKVEHKLFSFISSNWRGQPLLDYETIVSLISSTKTSKGLSVSCYLDHSKYELGRKVSNYEKSQLNLHRSDFHGEWNYTISPRKQT